ncbi:hypothetical protein GCM10028858_15950 [Halorubrum pallidum]
MRVGTGRFGGADPCSVAGRGGDAPNGIETISVAGTEPAGMSDTDEAEEAEDVEPAVELGEGPDVAGEPIARVASRLTWPAKRSDVVNQEGDAAIRTPDGARDLDDVLADAEVPLFESRSEFVATVEELVGRGPVATE